MKLYRILISAVIIGYCLSWNLVSAASLNVYVTPDLSVTTVPVMHGQIDPLFNGKSRLQLSVVDLPVGEYQLCRNNEGNCEVIASFTQTEDYKPYYIAAESGCCYRELINTSFSIRETDTQQQLAAFIYTKDALKNNLSKLLTRVIVDANFQVSYFGTTVAFPDNGKVIISEPGMAAPNAVPTEPKGSLYIYDLVSRTTERLQVGEDNFDLLGEDFVNSSDDGNVIAVSSSSGPILLSKTAATWQANAFPLQSDEIILSASGQTAFAELKGGSIRGTAIFEISGQSITLTQTILYEEDLNSLQQVSATDDTLVVFDRAELEVKVWVKGLNNQWMNTQTITDPDYFFTTSRVAISGDGRRFFVSTGFTNLSALTGILSYARADTPGAQFIKANNIYSGSSDLHASLGEFVLDASYTGDTLYANTVLNGEHVILNELVGDNTAEYYQKPGTGFQTDSGAGASRADLHPTNGSVIFSTGFSENEASGVVQRYVEIY